MTLLLVILMLALVWLSGLGATLLLFRSPDAIPRLLVCPFIGITVSVLLFFFLLPLNLTGPGTSILDITLLAALAIAGLIVSPLRRADWTETWPVLILCAAGFLLAAWPLLFAGYRDYMGFGNPDVPFFLSYLRYFSQHPVRLPDPSFYRGLDPGGFVGVLIYTYQTAAITGTTADELFATLCAAIVFLAPASVFLLCRIGLVLDRRRCLLISGFGVSSSLLAYTFYLHSLGTLTVMVMLPAVVGVAIAFFRNLDRRLAILLGALLAGSLYNYGQGFIIFTATCGAAGAMAVARRQIPWRRLVILGIAGLAAVAIPSLPYVITIVRVLRALSAGSRLSASANEIQTSFALVLTERGLPFVWGLAIPYTSSPRWLGTDSVGTPILIGAALLLFGMLALSFFRQFSGLPPAFIAAVAVAAALMLFFFLQGVAYGVFKLVAWIHFLFLTALAAAALAAFTRWRSKAGRIVPAVVLVLYLAGNSALALQLGRYSVGMGGGTLSSTPGLRLRDFRALEALPANHGVLVGLSDSVTRIWASPFLGKLEPLLKGSVHIYDPEFRFITDLGLFVEDSRPMRYLPDCDSQAHLSELNELHLRCADLRSSWFLDWSGGRDLGSTTRPAAWEFSVFALRQNIASDTVVLGRGWYRPEIAPHSSAAWQRRTFRWVRKRAEFFVLNPSPSMKRVRLAIASGFGLESRERHVTLFLNGNPVETIRVSGYSDLVTGPFTIPGPLSQLELSIEETVEPVKRSTALFNRWVPSDARRLNIAVAKLQLIEDGRETDHLPVTVDFTRAEPGEWGTPTDGIFADRWIGAHATVDLRVPPATSGIEFTGFAPGGPALKFPIQVELTCGSATLGTRRIDSPGEFTIRVPVSPGQLGPKASIGLHPSATFQPSALGISSDNRTLSLQVRSLGMVSGNGG